jgi:hypothetical protein
LGFTHGRAAGACVARFDRVKFDVGDFHSFNALLFFKTLCEGFRPTPGRNEKQVG